MTDRQTIKRHADLMDRMADTLGVDLEQVMLEGRMRMDQLSDAVLACTGCTNPGACDHWLMEQREAVAATPGYCRNADMFARLRDGKRA